MKRLTFLAFLLLGCLGLRAQSYYINLHQSGQIIYQNDVNQISDMHFEGNAPTMLQIDLGSGTNFFPLSAFDSITFLYHEAPQPGDAVTITYNGGSATIDNPYANDGVSVATNGANVTVNSTRTGVSYFVTGNSSNGSLTVYSNGDFSLDLSYLSLTSATTSAVNLASPVNVELSFEGVCTLADSPNSSVNGALYAAGSLAIDGTDHLRVTGNAKHGILVDGTLTVNSGEIDILDTDSDGIHGNSDLVWNGGTLNIVSAGSDALDISGNVTIQGGELTLNTTAEGARGIKVSGVFSMDDGELQISNTGIDGKGIKADSTLFINGGVIGITHSGDISKGIKCDRDITINGGDFTIVSSGSTVLETVNNQSVPSYCTAIKGEQNITINGGTFDITLPTTNHGGKGISADGAMSITDGTFTITTQGSGAAYTVSGNTKDAYTSACLRCDGNMEILGGDLTLSSSGDGGKGINVGDDSHTTSTLTIGTSLSGPTLNVTTTGNRITVSSGGGGPWGGGGDYANPKAIKARGVITVNNGALTVHTTKNGAEGLESKTQINIEGGQHYFLCYDDCINSSGKIFFNGGVTVCRSTGNDAVDSNAGTAGAITIGNGVAFAYTTKGGVEEGFDCDNNNYIRITGTGIGISAGGQQGGGGPGGGGGGGTIQNPAQGYYFYTGNYTYQSGQYYTLSDTSSSGGTNLVTFSFETNCTSRLSLITATGMVSGSTYYVKYGSSEPTNPTTSFHGLYLGGSSSASNQAYSFTAQ